MARRIVVDVNDLVDTWRQKTNLLSDYFGDLDALTTSVDSDLVGAIDSSIGANTSAFFPLTADRYADSSIDSDKIMQNSLLTKHFTLASVDGTIIGPQAVLTTNLKDLSVTTAKIADLAVDAGKIANAVITSSKFNSVVTLNIYDSGGSIVKTLRTPGS